MNKMQVTVKDFGALQGLKSQVEANSIINMLKAQGIAVEVGKKRRADGRGKPATIYEIPQTVTLTLFTDSDMPAESKSVPSETEEKPIMDHTLAALDLSTSVEAQD